MSKTLMIVAGEPSGDKHAAYLVRSLKNKSDLKVIGIGGDRMKEAGVELLHHVREMSVMGFSEILSKLPFFRRVRLDLLRAISKENPSAVVLVDFPGFNLRFAELAKKKGVKVVYFISPQVWAWGKRRVAKIRRFVDLMLTIFRFEEELYVREGVDAKFVGHPLMDELRTYGGEQIGAFRRSCLIPDGGKLLALFPGSRVQEVSRILPVMLESVEFLQEDLLAQGIRLQAVVGCAPGIEETVYEKYVEKSGVRVQYCHDSDLLMSSAEAGIIKSGTSTLEAALHDLPMVVVYKTGWLNYLIGRTLVKLKSISLVNIVAQKQVVQELVQDEFTSKRAAAVVKDILTKDEMARDIRIKYADLRAKLGGKGASDRAAELILGTL